MCPLNQWYVMKLCVDRNREREREGEITGSSGSVIRATDLWLEDPGFCSHLQILLSLFSKASIIISVIFYKSLSKHFACLQFLWYQYYIHWNSSIYPDSGKCIVSEKSFCANDCKIIYKEKRSLRWWLSTAQMDQPHQSNTIHCVLPTLMVLHWYCK